MRVLSDRTGGEGYLREQAVLTSVLDKGSDAEQEDVLVKEKSAKHEALPGKQRAVRAGGPGVTS